MHLNFTLQNTGPGRLFLYCVRCGKKQKQNGTCVLIEIPKSHFVVFQCKIIFDFQPSNNILRKSIRQMS